MTFLCIFGLLLAVVILFVKLSRLNENILKLERRLWNLERTREALPESTRTAVPAAEVGQQDVRKAAPEASRESPAGSPEVKTGLPTEPRHPGAPPPIQPPPVMAWAEVKREMKIGAGLPESQPRSKTAINWEQFLGVKMFAWIGGLILFLGVAFFVKHAFENNLISPRARIALGYLTGLGLVISGWFIPRERQAVTGQTLCATGILILYANIFASHAFYQLAGTTTAFALMTIVTVAAFFLAIRLDAQVVAVLGLLGGFLTPPLLSTGVDRPLGLFGYIALLDAGLLALGLRKKWNYLVLLGAAATVVMQFAWASRFYNVEKTFTAFGIFLFFAGLFVAGLIAAHRRRMSHSWFDAAAVTASASALLFAFYLVLAGSMQIAGRVTLVFGFVFLVDLGILAAAWLRDRLRGVHSLAGGWVFLLLTLWTARCLTEENLLAALAVYFVFAVFHSLAPVLMQQFRPVTSIMGWVHLWPPLTVLLILFPIFNLAETSFLIWPLILLIDGLALALAFLTASVLSFAAVFLLTMVVTACWIAQLPREVTELPGLLGVVAVFSIFFLVTAVVAGRKLLAQSVDALGKVTASIPGLNIPPVPAAWLAQMSSLGAVMPFMLLSLAVLRLPLENPSLVFSLALLLIILMLALIRWFAVDSLAAVGLASVLLLEWAWYAGRYQVESAGLLMGWNAGFGLVFLGFPFLLREHLRFRKLPWSVAALSLPLHFFLMYAVAQRGFPDFGYPGLLPAALAVPCLLGLFKLWPALPEESEVRTSHLAWFGGASLFFLTMIFPVQFDREWLTIGWAMEGAALLWLFHRAPHPGLQWVGAGLLAIAFARLALNPTVLEYHPRTGTALFNWYLYAYGLVTACLMAGGRLMAPPRNRLQDLNAPPCLFGMGAVLAFLLLNIEIADYFSTGAHLTFQFSGNLAQDMTYSLAWGLFALGLLGFGFKLNHRAARYSGLGLLMVTIIKIFLHDLWRLGGLYRVGSLVGLAVVLILVSFIYQRFLSSTATAKETPPNAEAAEPKP